MPVAAPDDQLAFDVGLIEAKTLLIDGQFDQDAPALEAPSGGRKHLMSARIEMAPRQGSDIIELAMEADPVARRPRIDHRQAIDPIARASGGWPGGIERTTCAAVDTLEMAHDQVDGDEHALARIRAICSTLEGAAEGLLQDRPLFHVRRRRFAIFNGASSPSRRRWNAAGRSLHFLSDPAERDALLQDPRFTLSPHHGERGWLAVHVDADAVDWQELTELLHAAHQQVVSRR